MIQIYLILLKILLYVNFCYMFGAVSKWNKKAFLKFIVTYHQVENGIAW